MTIGPGTTLADRYTLQRAAWRSARGTVWKARDRTLDRPVYLLLLDDVLADDKQARRAFVDEAGTLAGATNPGIAAIYDIGVDPPFVVFADPGGGRLVDRTRQGPLDEIAAARIISNLARAMQTAPDTILDLDPERILLAPDGRAKIAPVGVRQPSDVPVRPSMLAALAVRILTGDDPGPKLSKRNIPDPMFPVLRQLLAADPAVSLEDLVTACAIVTRPDRVTSRPRSSRRSHPPRTDLGWLVGVTLIVALAVVAVVLGPRLIDRFGAAPSPSPPAPSGSVTQGQPLEVVDIRDFDPDGNGEEHPDQVGRVLDGDPLTAWSTLDYRRATMDKDGVGLLLDLGEVTSVRSVVVQTSLPGWKAEIRVGAQDAETAGGFVAEASFTAGTKDTVALPAGTRARFVLVWLTELADGDGGGPYPFRASIAELSVLG